MVSSRARGAVAIPLKNRPGKCNLSRIKDGGGIIGVTPWRLSYLDTITLENWTFTPADCQRGQRLDAPRTVPTTSGYAANPGRRVFTSVFRPRPRFGRPATRRGRGLARERGSDGLLTDGFCIRWPPVRRLAGLLTAAAKVCQPLKCRKYGLLTALRTLSAGTVRRLCGLLTARRMAVAALRVRLLRVCRPGRQAGKGHRWPPAWPARLP